jgi:hypothetical protein
MTSPFHPRGGWVASDPRTVATVAKNDLLRVPQVFLLDSMLWRRPPRAAAAALLCAAMLAAAPPACSRGHERVAITTPGEGQVLYVPGADSKGSLRLEYSVFVDADHPVRDACGTQSPSRTHARAHSPPQARTHAAHAHTSAHQNVFRARRPG